LMWANKRWSQTCRLLADWCVTQRRGPGGSRGGHQPRPAKTSGRQPVQPPFPVEHHSALLRARQPAEHPQQHHPRPVQGRLLVDWRSLGIASSRLVGLSESGQQLGSCGKAIVAGAKREAVPWSGNRRRVAAAPRTSRIGGCTYQPFQPMPPLAAMPGAEVGGTTT
jgi:hypothetical protein